MYRLVIVDDEPIIREGLKQTVNWDALGFKVAGEADNGGSALELIKVVSPHVVLADIRMPAIDGLAMLKKIKEDHPAVKVVLLSGHEEFEYAREGMLLGAEGYVLKLSIERDIPEIFGRIRKKLDEEEKARSMVNNLKVERRQLIYDVFIRKAINGEATESEARSLLSVDKDIPILEGAFCCVCIHLEAGGGKGEEYSIASRKESMDSFISETSFKVEKCDEMLLMQSGCRFVIVYYSDSADTEGLYDKITYKWKRYSDSLHGNVKELKWKAMVGLGNAGIGWKSISLSYLQARKAAMFKTTGDMMTVLAWKDVREAAFRQVLSVKEQNEFIQSIIMGDAGFVRQQLNYLFKGLEAGKEPLDMQGYQQFVVELLILIKWKLKELDVVIEDNKLNSSEISKIVNDMQDYEELGRWVRDNIMNITRKCYEIRKQPSRQLIMKAANYIDSNFSVRIHLEEMADYVHMSPSYFSVLFKQHTGKSFTSYLIDIRMAQAHKLLREKHTVSEAAERVGYQDFRHFSKTFRKYFGMNPSEV